MLNMCDVYLSSTLDDLMEEREAVKKVLAEYGHSYLQSYTASEGDLIGSCVADVKSCRLYVGIVGGRYGYCPDDPTQNPMGLSITELELGAASRRLVFVKDEDFIFARFSDAATGENSNGARIKKFRQQIETTQGIRTARFQKPEELPLKVLAAVREALADPLMTWDARHPGEMATELGIVVDALSPQLPADVELAQQVRSDPRVRLIVVDPGQPDYLARLEDACGKCRAIAWRLDRRSLPIYQNHAALLTTALKDQRLRRGGAGLLLAQDLGSDPLPADWQSEAVIWVDDTLQFAFDELHRCLRKHVRALSLGLAIARPVAVPVVVLAMTQVEAEDLLDEPAPGANGSLDSLRQELERRLAAQRARTVGGKWPAGVYGPQREDWHPFGPGKLGAMALLNSTLERINNERSKRDRVFIRHDNIRLVPHVYRSDDMLQPAYGARKLLQQVRDRGCLVLVDELSLLHPTLRQQADWLLRGDNVAVVSSQPLDPPSEAMGATLGERSCLDVGALLRRFGAENDPRCELTVSNPERLLRWLLMVLPELVAVLGGSEVNPRFVGSGDLYEPTGGVA